MVRSAFWVAILLGALAAIVAGFVQATATTHPPPIAQVRRAPAEPLRTPSAAALAREERTIVETAVVDQFSEDDVVVDRPRLQAMQWQRQRIALVVAGCGNSVAAESEFLRLGYPAAFVVDPHASQAAAFAQLVRTAGQPLFVQLSSPPTRASLAALHQQLGSFDGVAARDAQGFAPVLRDSGLSFIDERGDAANQLAFAALGIPLIQRDVTADDRTGSGYVVFMLERAASLSGRIGRVVVLVRPLPSTLAALRTFTATANVDMVSIR